ncbi:Predicted metal-dependent hydrolase, TIM-barrel fold [Sphingobium faniae]|nr:Predicted metal-dependent hydrolase, TIM-barrel fold [Sphingobium faniae]
MPRERAAAEPVFRPEWPIVDAHHHLWDGHLRGSGLAVEVAVYEAEDFLADIAAAGHRVIASVAVESFAHYGAHGPVGETMHADAAARAHPGICNAIVGWADMRGGDALIRLLDAHQAASPRLRGIRHSAAWDADPAVTFATLAAYSGRDMMADPAFIAGVRHMGERGLVFETFITHAQLGEAARLAQAAPDTAIVIDHVGMPLSLGGYGARPQAVRATWESGMAALAQCPNVHIKLGGLTMPTTLPGSEANTRTSDGACAAISPWMNPVIALFGPDRCLFESNFPVEKRDCDYRTLWNALKKIAAGHGDDAARAMLADNALRLYGIARPS